MAAMTLMSKRDHRDPAGRGPGRKTHDRTLDGSSREKVPSWRGDLSNTVSVGFGAMLAATLMRGGCS